MNFASLGLESRLCTNVAALGYENPSPIQLQAIPAVLTGKDLIGLAQTGTGKTAAFALPMIQRLSAMKKRGVKALIVAPTRELAQQIVDAVKKYAEGTNVKSTPIYGGVRMGSQLKRLKAGVDIVVGTPGRLVDHINRGSLDLSGVEILVLDEADHMFDMGFLPDIKKLISFVPKKRQTLLFSATMPSEIRGLAEDVLINPMSIQVSNGEMAETVSHSLFPVSGDLKGQLLESILKQFEVKSTIIFTRTKQRAQRLNDTLQRNGYKVACLQGNLSQNRRQEAIKGFKAGQYDILVATDIAARGIDVQQVTHVINYDIPMTVEGYTHRIGRTGRAAKEGEAFTLITREDESRVRAIERKLGSKIERRRVEGFAYGKDDMSELNPKPEGRSSMRRGGDRPFRKAGGFRKDSAPKRFGDSKRPDRGDRNTDRREKRFDKPEGRSFDRAAKPESRESFKEGAAPSKGRFNKRFDDRKPSDRSDRKPRFGNRERGNFSRDSRGEAGSADRKPRGEFRNRFEDRKPFNREDRRPSSGGGRSFNREEGAGFQARKPGGEFRKRFEDKKPFNRDDKRPSREGGRGFSRDGASASADRRPRGGGFADRKPRTEGGFAEKKPFNREGGRPPARDGKKFGFKSKGPRKPGFGSKPRGSKPFKSRDS